MSIAGRIVFGFLSVAALLKFALTFHPAVTLGHVLVLWGVCWLGAKLTARSWLWLPVALVCFGIAWVFFPIVFLIFLYVCERASRPQRVLGDLAARPRAGEPPPQG